MVDRPLLDVRVAILTDTDFEQVELSEPRKALENAGAEALIVSSKLGRIDGMKHDVKLDSFEVDLSLDQADPTSFDALLMPGGALNADHLRMVPEAQAFVRHFADNGKPMAVICHAPWVLASAGVARGRKLTSYYTIQDDMRNAGANWVDEEVVVDGNLVTSRQPDDIPAFNREMVELFSRAGRSAASGERVTEPVQEGTPAQR